MTWTDAALEMLRRYEGRLKGREVRIRSLLMVVRNELSRDLIEETEPDKAEVPCLDEPEASGSAGTPRAASHPAAG